MSINPHTTTENKEQVFKMETLESLSLAAEVALDLQDTRGLGIGALKITEALLNGKTFTWAQGFDLKTTTPKHHIWGIRKCINSNDIITKRIGKKRYAEWSINTKPYSVARVRKMYDYLKSEVNLKDN